MNDLRKVWKKIQDAPHPMAVLVFQHGVETLAIHPETPDQNKQLQRLLQDLDPHLVGVYDKTVLFPDLAEDIRHLSLTLAYGDSHAVVR